MHGLDCAEEVALIRNRLAREPGIRHLSFDIVQARMRVEFDPGQSSSSRIMEAVSETGLSLETWLDRPAAAIGFRDRYGRIALAALSGASMLGAMLWQAFTTGDFIRSVLAHEHTGHTVSMPALVLCLIAIASGAVFVVPKALHSFRRLQPDMNALVVVSLFGAMYLREWIEGATLSFLFAAAALLETYSLARARRAVESLMAIAPGDAAVVHGDHEHKTPAAKVPIGALVRVRPGERLPCDGVIEAGGSDINQSAITGEAIPVWRGPGDEVFAGAVNGDGVLEIRVTKQASNTTIARIVRMVEGLHHRRGVSEQFIEKFSRYYTPAMMLLAMFVATVPPLVAGGDWGEWFYHSMVILLISCPCALVISTPVSVVAALAAAAREGVLIKGGAFVEEAARVHVMAFDKTGVLTSGRPHVREVVPLGGRTVEQVLSRLAALQSRSSHPLAGAILRYAHQQGIEPRPVEAFQALQGRGAEAVVDGETFWAGSLRLLREKGFGLEEIAEQVADLARRELTLMACGTGQEAWALVALEDPIRPEAAATLDALRAEGLNRLVMLTGDNAGAAARVASHLPLTEIQADLLPADKSAAIEGLERRYGRVAMVGDGVNDTQAMARSTLGIALPGAGMDVVLETADVVLMSGGLAKLPFLVRHSRRTRSVILQNIVLALLLKAAFIVLAFLGLATLWMAVAADMGATLLVTFNGLRLLRAR